MHRTTMMGCALLLALAPMGGRASTAEADNAAVMRYMMELYNMPALITAQARASALPGQAGEIMHNAGEQFDVAELAALMGPVLGAQVPAAQVSDCAAAMRQPQNVALLATLRGATDTMAAVQALSPEQTQVAMDLFSRPCMASVVAVIQSPEAREVAGRYGRSLACAAVRDDAQALQVLRDAGHCAP